MIHDWAPAMNLRRKLILMMGGAGCAYAALIPVSAPGLDSIECNAPPVFNTAAEAPLPAELDTRMIALRQKAGRALAELQTRTLR